MTPILREALRRERRGDRLRRARRALAWTVAILLIVLILGWAQTDDARLSGNPAAPESGARPTFETIHP